MQLKILGKQIVAVFIATLYPLSVYGYIGPGMGLGVIGVVLGILGAIILGFVAILWYPLKRLFSKVDKKEEKEEPGETDNEEGD